MSKSDDTDDDDAPAILGGESVFALDASKLRPGDVILTSSPGQFGSNIIRLATGGDYSHAVLVVRPPTAWNQRTMG